MVKLVSIILEAIKTVYNQQLCKELHYALEKELESRENGETSKFQANITYKEVIEKTQD